MGILLLILKILSIEDQKLSIGNTSYGEKTVQLLKMMLLNLNLETYSTLHYQQRLGNIRNCCYPKTTESVWLWIS